MNDEKISIRIDSDELAKIDEYVSAHPEEGSRSLFIKNAVRARLDRDAEPSAECTEAKTDAITLRLPPRMMAAVEAYVSDGYYLSSEEAIRHIIMTRLSEMVAAGDAAASAAAQRATPDTI